MKRSVKLWLAAAAALVLLGALTVGGVMAANQWDLAALGGADYETSTFEIGESFRDISVSCGAEDVRFLPSDSGRCRVVFYEEKSRTPFASVKDGTLSIGVTDARKRLEDYISFAFERASVTVYLPPAAYGALTVTGGTGDVSVPAEFAFDSVGISVSTGDVDCRASASGQLRIGTDTGKIRLDGVSAGSLELAVSTGAVELRSVACAGAAALTVDTGKAFLTDVTCGSFATDGGTGDLFLTDVVAAGTLGVERSTGDVRLDRCDAAEISIRTDTGDVIGTLRSEKVFIVRTDTGRVDVPDTAAGGKCTITTDTGDVSISFA